MKAGIAATLIGIDGPLAELRAIPGAILWMGNDMMFSCPCGCGLLGGIRVGPGGWINSGTLDRPSLEPSVGFYGRNPPGSSHHWHGYLRNGVWERC